MNERSNDRAAGDPSCDCATPSERPMRDATVARVCAGGDPYSVSLDAWQARSAAFAQADAPGRGTRCPDPVVRPVSRRPLVGARVPTLAERRSADRLFGWLDMIGSRDAADSRRDPYRVVRAQLQRIPTRQLPDRPLELMRLRRKRGESLRRAVHRHVEVGSLMAQLQQGGWGCQGCDPCNPPKLGGGGFQGFWVIVDGYDEPNCCAVQVKPGLVSPGAPMSPEGLAQPRSCSGSQRALHPCHARAAVSHQHAGLGFQGGPRGTFNEFDDLDTALRPVGPPWGAYGKFRVTSGVLPDGTIRRPRGSGAVIGPRHVLTAAHVLWDELVADLPIWCFDGAEATFAPGEHPPNVPPIHGAMSAPQIPVLGVAYDKRYLGFTFGEEPPEYQWDLAVAILAENDATAFGPWMSLCGDVDGDYYDDRPLGLLGYPGDSTGLESDQLHAAFGTLVSRGSDRAVYTNMDANGYVPGMSGSPVQTIDRPWDDQPHAWGPDLLGRGALCVHFVHNHYSVASGHHGGVRLTNDKQSAIFDLICASNSLMQPVPC